MCSIKTHWLFLLIVSFILILLQYTPYLYHLSQTPSDRVYLGAERYPPDYYVYLFYVNQGFLGNNLVYDYYTNEPHQGSFVHYEYLLAGKLGSLLGLSLPATYYLFRTATLILYILVSFWFIGLFFKKELPSAINAKSSCSYFLRFNPSLLHKLTFLLSFFWSGLFWPEITGSGINLKSYFDFYQPPDLINRLGFEPHKLIGMSLFLVIMYFIPNTITKYYILLLLFLLSGLIHGITSISLIFTLFAFLLFRFLIKPSLKTLISLKSLILPIFLLVLPLLYWHFIFLKNPVWYGVFNAWEGYFVNIDKNSPFFPTLIGYLFILGPLIFLAFIGLKKFLTENKNLGLLLFSFLTSNLFLFFLGYIFLGTSKHRYFQTPYLVGWTILAGYGLMQLTEKFADKSKEEIRSDGWRATGSPRRGPLVGNAWGWRETGPVASILWLITLLLLLPGLPNFKQGLEREFSQFGTPPNISFLAYPKKAWYSALLWMKNNTPSDSIILSLPTSGQIIPAIPGRRVVAGDYVHTLNFLEKKPVIEKFYKSQMSLDEAKNFLIKQKVNYVFYGWEEKEMGILDSYSSLLAPVFTNNEAIIYKTTL